MEKQYGAGNGHSGWTQPSAEVVVGPPPIPELIKSRGPSSDKISQAGDRRSQAINHNLYRQNYPGS
jgi:hypothetical protein